MIQGGKRMKKQLLFFIALLLLSLVLAGCGESDNTSDDVATDTVQTVENLVSQAREDAQNLTEEQLNEAVTYIKENAAGILADNAVAEQIIYYGTLLQYGCETTNEKAAELGAKAAEAAQNIYKNAGSLDFATAQKYIDTVKEVIQSMN